MPCSIYLDSSIICALADPPARAALPPALQQFTRRWWRSLPHTRNLCTSEFALAHINAGPSHLTSARLAFAGSLLVLPPYEEAESTMELFLVGGGLSEGARRIGTEVATAAFHDTQLFVSWDWQRLEARRLPYLRVMLEEAGLPPVEFVTPIQLLEVSYETL